MIKHIRDKIPRGLVAAALIISGFSRLFTLKSFPAKWYWLVPMEQSQTTPASLNRAALDYTSFVGLEKPKWICSVR
jgi:hypothetical protein